jgi:hypothetical protein
MSDQEWPWYLDLGGIFVPITNELGWLAIVVMGFGMMAWIVSFLIKWLYLFVIATSKGIPGKSSTELRHLRFVIPNIAIGVIVLGLSIYLGDTKGTSLLADMVASVLGIAFVPLFVYEAIAVAGATPDEFRSTD